MKLLRILNFRNLNKFEFPLISLLGICVQFFKTPEILFRCEMYRPPRAHHCRICRRCIRRMDHHCPWINNCVGEWNQKYFIQFLFYVAILSAYSLFLVGFSWYYHGADKTGIPINRELMQIKQSRILHSVLLVLESILFGLFVSAIGKNSKL